VGGEQGDQFGAAGIPPGDDRLEFDQFGDRLGVAEGGDVVVEGIGAAAIGRLVLFLDQAVDPLVLGTQPMANVSAVPRS